MDPAELPRRQQGVRRVDEGFWRQSTSSYAAPAAAKSKRKQTLERAPRKAVRIAKPGRQAPQVPHAIHVSALLHFRVCLDTTGGVCRVSSSECQVSTGCISSQPGKAYNVICADVRPSAVISKYKCMFSVLMFHIVALI